jgi:hypothetical protein
MTRLTIIFILTLCSLTTLFGQKSIVTDSTQERYTYKTKWGTYSYIKLYSNGRFEIIANELCYRYIEDAGIFEKYNDSLIFKYFKEPKSPNNIIKSPAQNYSPTNIKIQTLSAKDSSKLAGIKIVARVELGGFYNFEFINQEVDRSGFLNLIYQLAKS